MIILFIIFVNILQKYSPKILPEKLKSWSWLPRPLHTLAWYDEHFCGVNHRFKCCKVKVSADSTKNVDQNDASSTVQFNRTYQPDGDGDDRLSGVSTQF